MKNKTKIFGNQALFDNATSDAEIETPNEKAAIEAAICEPHRQAIIPVICPHCGSEHADFTHESEFIGWHGVCVKCVLVDGVEL